MTPPKSARRRCLLLAGLALLALPASHASEPLSDRVQIDGLEGPLHDAERGWVALPRSERLRAIALTDRCSAIGGPRGKFKVAQGRLWLYGFNRCGGDLSLSEIYPGSRAPILANWVTGFA